MDLSQLNIGAWLTIGHPQVAEAMCSTGLYSWLAVDIEHSTPTIDQAASIFLACEKWNVFPMIRTLGHDPFRIRRFLDAGAKGVIIPVVESVQELGDITKHLFYPPKGKRGVCLSRMNEWGDNFQEYYDQANPIIIPQIESVLGVKNIDEIINHQDVSGVFVGPYDLTGSLEIPGQFENEKLLKELEKVKIATKKANKALGLHVVDPDSKELKMKVEEGYNFIAFGTDLVCMRKPLKIAIEELERK